MPQPSELTVEHLAGVYPELRRLAAKLLASERPDHTLQPTALVHEAFLRLADQTHLSGRTTAQVLCAASRAMRHVLVDHARQHQALKRTPPGSRVLSDDAFALYQDRAVDILGLHEALQRLAAFDDDLASVVELRFFGGLSETEIAQALDCSTRTVRRNWVLARRWLNHELSK